MHNPVPFNHARTIQTTRQGRRLQGRNHAGLVIFDRRCRFEIGRKVRLRYWGHGEKWFYGILRNIDPIRVDR